MSKQRFLLVYAVIAACTISARAQSAQNVTVYATHSALTGSASTPTTATSVIAQAGYHASGDGGWAEYDWSAASTATADGYTVILPAGQSSGTAGRYILRGDANVLLYGADKTGTNDSTSAINAALSQTLKCVYIPTGTYKISNALTGQTTNNCIYGDGRVNSVLQVNSSTFNLSALGVIVLPNSSGATSGIVRDIGISFAQPTVSSRSSLVAFPPAIYMQNAGRTIIQRIQIDGANTCIDARGNAGGAFIDTVECGAFTMGLEMDGSLDANHIHNFHEWDFGIGASQMQAIYGDGNNTCMSIGRIDGADFSDIACFEANVIYTSNANNSEGVHEWTNVLLDTGQWTQSGGLNYLRNVSTVTGGTGNSYRFSVSGGILHVDGFYLASNQGAASVQVTGGEATLLNGELGCANPTVSCATVSGGSLYIKHSELPIGGFGAATTATWIAQSSTGVLGFSDNWVTPGVPGGTYGLPLVGFATDVSGNFIANNNTLGWPVAYPSSGTNGNYVGSVRTGTFTIGALPTCKSALAGAHAYVTNGQSSATFLGAVSTTGSTVAPVLCNGSAWVYGG